MTKPPSNSSANRSAKTAQEDQRFARLRAEAKAPYRGLRLFIYFTFGASAFIGGFIFFFKLLAGEDVSSTLPNLALQLGILSLMIGLFRFEQRRANK